MPYVQFTAPDGLPQVVVTTELYAPRDLVFRAYTDPGLLVRWLGPRGLTMDVERLEVRDGGRWRFVHRDEHGRESAFHGVFHNEPTPDSTIRTFEYEGAPGHVSLEELELEELDQLTFLRVTAVFHSMRDRDVMLEAGMERGVRESFDRLEQLLEQLQKSDHDELERGDRAA